MALNQAVEIFHQREETFRRRLERETERRRTAERQVKTAQEAAAASRLNASLMGRCKARMGPGKAHQRSYSHGGQQNLFPQLATASSPPGDANGVPASPKATTTPLPATATGKMFIVEECGPDFAEGGTEYNVTEEHFYDAIDAQLDKMHRKFDALNCNFFI